MRPGQPPVQIDYSMAKTPAGWKVYDVIVGGVSLVTNYRDEFNEQVQSGGIDGLIKTLAGARTAEAPRSDPRRECDGASRRRVRPASTTRWTLRRAR